MLAYAWRAVIGWLNYRRCIRGVVTGILMWKSKKKECVCVCVCTLMKWREGLVLHDEGKAASQRSQQRVNWVKQGVYGPSCLHGWVHASYMMLVLSFPQDLTMIRSEIYFSQTSFKISQVEKSPERKKIRNQALYRYLIKFTSNMLM